MLGRSFRSRRGFRDLLNSKIFLTISLILILFFSFSLIKEFLRKVEINREIKELESEVSLLEERNTKMADLIQYLNSSSWQEKEVKDRLNLQSPGEKVVFIPEENQTNLDTPEPIAANGQSAEEKISNPQKWLNYFLAN